MKKFIAVVLAISPLALQAVELMPITPGETLIKTRPGHWPHKALTANTKFNKGQADTFYALKSSKLLKVKARGVISREFKDFSCEGYDKLVLFCYPRGAAKLELIVDTDIGEKKAVELPVPRFHQMEVIADISGAKKINKISIIVEADKAGEVVRKAHFNFLMLRNSAEYAVYQNYWEKLRTMDWSRYFVSKVQYSEPTITFAPGEFAKYREFCLNDQKLKATLQSQANGVEHGEDPQKNISIHPQRWYATKANKDVPPLLMHRANYAALAGAILKNDKLMKKADAYALALSFSGTWSSGYGYWKDFDLSAVYGDFGSAYQCTKIANTLDLASGALSNQGRRIIMKALVKKGLSNLAYSLWSRPAGGNQGVLFTGGRLSALLACEKFLDPQIKKRLGTAYIKGYTDLVKKEMDDCMNRVFFADGGYGESTGYLTMTLNVSMRPYLYYANARKLPLSSVIPKNMKNFDAFGQILYSTSKNPSRKAIAFGQSLQVRLPFRTAAFVALCCPGSIWQKFLPTPDKIAEAAKTGLPYDPICWQLANRLPKKQQAAVLKPFTFAKSIGVVNSFRKFGGEWMKIVFMGRGRHRGKADYDCGNFMIEYAGDAFAEEMAGYGDTTKYKESGYHNMLIPSGTDYPAGQNSRHYYYYMHKNNITAMPEAGGNEKSFSAKITNLAKAWERKYFKKYCRSIESPTPETVTITDTYKLGRGAGATGVDFTWITALKTRLQDNKIIITGDFGAKCELTWSKDCTAKIEKFRPGKRIAVTRMGYPDDREFSRIMIHRDGKKGQISVKAKFIPPKK